MNTLNKTAKTVIPMFMLMLSISVTAQNWNKYSTKSHEIGFYVGSAHFTTDYGERYLFKSNVGGNVGIGIGIIHYLTFTDYRYRWNQQASYFTEHFRFRNEISYMSAKLEHYGKYVDESNTTLAADKLRAMHGKTSVFNIGTQLEFHIKNIEDFGSRRDPDMKWSPYVSLGLLGTFYNPSLESDLGDWRTDPSVLYPKWAVPGTVSEEKDFTFSATTSIGTRKKFKDFSDIFIEAKWQYYFSNWVDGLNATDPAANNKFNDWNMSIQIGYIYYLN